jgi:type IV secretion system protein VirB6
MAYSCAMAQSDDGLVQGLLSSVDCNVRSMSEAGYGALSQANSPMAAILTAVLTLYIAFIGYSLLIGRTPLRVGDLSVSAFKIGAVLALATSWPTYQHVVFDTLFSGPEQLATNMLDAIQPSGSLLHGDPFAGLQVAYDQLQASANDFTKHSLSTASPLQGGNAGAALALTVSATLILLTSLGAVLASKIVLGLLLGLGPLFIAMLLFDATRGVFEGWLRASIAFALAPLMAVLGLVVELTMIGPDLVRLADLRSQGLVDLAPANAIFLLVLISTGVSLALAIAFSLRLPQVQRGSRGDLSREVSTSSALVTAANAQAPGALQAEPRAAAVVAATTAMDRREARVISSDSDGSRRISVSRARDTSALGAPAFAPIGQSYRRAAQPRRAASNQRRDR